MLCNTYIVGLSADEIYYELCAQLLSKGAIVKPRGLETLELQDVTLELLYPQNSIVTHAARKLDRRYLVGELCFYLAKRRDLAFIEHYSSFWRKVSDDGMSVNSAYGYRLFSPQGLVRPQFDYALSVLRADPTSRKAVMPIYSLNDARESNDNPCTMFLQLLIRDGELNCFVFMRSNDVWFGLSYDLPFFTLVQTMAWVALRDTLPNLRLGVYRHHAVSMHAYKRNWPALQQLVHTPSTLTCTDQAEGRVPLLIQADIASWFEELLAYETLYRQGIPHAHDRASTQFQQWCINQLK